MTITIPKPDCGKWGFQAFLLAALLVTLQPTSFGAEKREYSDKIAPHLQDRLAIDEYVRVLVMMSDRVDTRQLAAMSPYRSVRHELVVSSLQEKAESTQAELLRYLEERKQQGDVQRYRSAWITNLVAVEARSEVIQEIAVRPEVEMVYLDYPVELIRPVASAPSESIPGAAEPGLIDINAHKLWDIGITGSNVIVMNIDTGVDGGHPALADRWRGLEVDPEWAWFNPDNPGQQFPQDFEIHGTHTMGTLTGLDPNTDDTIGVAIGSKWIAAAWDWNGDLNKFISDAIMGFNWGADPDGDPQTSDDVPAVISNSWGIGVIFGQPPCDDSFWEAIDNAEAAGAAVVFAAGNEGSGATTLRAPADRNTTSTNCYSVGALNPGSMTIASFSSRGPTACPGTDEERIKPEVCARGVAVRSSWAGTNSYLSLDGTSMACPHVAGAIALLRDAFPNATVDELKTALMETAVDLGTSGEDNTYGHGRIDVWEAYNNLLGGSDICADITSFQARCVAGDPYTLQFRITLENNVAHSGEEVTFDVDGVQHVAVIGDNGTHSRAKLSLSGQSAGSHTVSLVDPAGCFSAIDVDCGAAGTPDHEWETMDALWGDSDLKASITPAATELVGNYPNPFNPSTTISYTLGEDSWVTLKVYNTLGQEIATLVDGYQTTGYRTSVWNGRNDFGASVASGIYLYRLTAGDVVRTERMLFMK